MDPSSVEPAATFLKEGLAGAVIVVLLGACGVLYRAVYSMMAARIEDAKAYNEKYTALVEKVMDAQKDLELIMQMVNDRLKGGRRS